MSQIFLFLYERLSRMRWILWVGMACMALTFSFMSSKLELVQDLAKVLPGSLGKGKTGLALENSKALDKVVVQISAADTSAQGAVLMAYADTLYARIQADTVAVNRIKDLRLTMPADLQTQTYAFFHSHLPVYLTEEDYKKIENGLEINRLRGSVESGIKLMSLPSAGFLRSYFVTDPLFFTPLAMARLSALQADTNFGLQNGYLVSKDGMRLLMVIQPRFLTGNIDENARLLARIDAAIEGTNAAFLKKATAVYFGGIAVAAANAAQVKTDVYITLSLSLSLICLLIWGYYRRLSLTVALMVPVAFGMLFAAACTWWVQGQIAALAMASGAVVLGIIIDYSTHFFAHYQHVKSIRQTIKDISLPLMVGNLSTVGAFFSLMLADSKVLSDFGMFAGFSLVGGVLFTLIVLPHISAPFVGIQSRGWFAQLLEKVGTFEPEKKKWLVGSSILVTVVFFFLYDRVTFNGNLSDLNYVPEKLQKAEKEIFGEPASSQRNMYLSFNGASANEVMAQSESIFQSVSRLKHKGLITNAFDPSVVLPSQQEQQRKLERWKQFWTTQRVTDLEKNLQRVASEMHIKPDAFQPFINRLRQPPQALDPAGTAFVKTQFMRDFLLESNGQATLMASLKVPVQYAGAVHQFLENQPYGIVLDRQHLTTQMVDSVKDNFNQILALTSLLVFGILLLSYGRIELALMTFLPMLICWVWILGLMVVLGMEFNVVNIIISTFIFGLGDDFSIFIMDGLQTRYREGKNNLTSFKTAIVLSMLTTLVGVGVLIFAQHPALHSIALISVVGIFCAMYIAFIFIPLLFKWTITDRAAKGLPPATFLGITRSVFAFLYYLLGCILLTIIGVFLFKILRIRHESARLLYHRIIQLFSKSLMYVMYMVKKRIVNPANERFQTPAVIVANHQSFLDILSILMLHHKLIFFTNHWVWNSPFFGRLVQMAEFYSVENGVENSIELVRRKVALGYSIVIFPEGGRSQDGTIRRFHKGAFFLAQELAIDIVPIVLHGTAAAMPKADYLLSKGIITIQIMKRISSSELPYQETAKRTAGIIKEAYAKLNTVEFFRYRLIQNYILKGPVLEWYMRIKTRLEKNYALFDNHLPEAGRMYDLGCGNGFMTHMLSWTKPNRQWIGLDYDEAKVATAAHVLTYGQNPPLFLEGDVTAFEPEPCEGIVLADVLHYLPAEAQLPLVEKCLHALRPKGVMLLRDGDRDQQEKHTKTRITEKFSTQWFGFNKTNVDALQFASLAEIMNFVAAMKGYVVERIEHSEYTSNTVLKITRIAEN